MDTLGAKQLTTDIAGFPAYVRVMTDQGLVRIQDVRVGDRVLSKPESGFGEQCYQRVSKTFSFKEQEIWIIKYCLVDVAKDCRHFSFEKVKRLAFKGQARSFEATPNHPFWVKGVGWTRCDQLKFGDLVETVDATKNAFIYYCGPVMQTTDSKISALYSERNLCDADKKGFEIDDLNYYYFILHDLIGERSVLADGQDFEKLDYDGQIIEVTDQTFCTTICNIEVEDSHTLYISGDGLWIHNANCGGFPDVRQRQYG